MDYVIIQFIVTTMLYSSSTHYHSPTAVNLQTACHQPIQDETFDQDGKQLYPYSLSLAEIFLKVRLQR